MVRIFALIFILLIPVCVALYPQHLPQLLSRGCYFETVQVRDDGTETVVAQGRWRFEFKGLNGTGTYAGRVIHRDAQDNIIREVPITRSLTTASRPEGAHIFTVTTSVSRVAGDNLTDEYIARYVSPMLVKDNHSLTVTMKTTGGSLMSGTNGNPRLKCGTNPDNIIHTSGR